MKPTTNTEQLILAMASVDEVLSALHTEREFASEEKWSMEEQDRFAHLVDCCWTELGSLNRYTKALVRTYVSKLEKQGGVLNSDKLMDLVFRISLIKETIPHPEESCYLCFRIPPNDDKLLKIRIYPFHNDVALRLWEAGATLAEYFLEYPDFVQGKRVIELGAGVGLTGLVVAGSCGAEGVYLTDYTEVCRANMAHNILINQDWLQASRLDSSTVTQGYLEWSSFVEGDRDEEGSDTLRSSDHDHKCLKAFDDADILLAADVTYDLDSLKYLVAIVVQFLQKAPTRKEAIFGITRRNMTTFNTFLALLKDEGIDYKWIWSRPEYHPLPIRFPTKFTQERSDVRIASLRIQ